MFTVQDILDRKEYRLVSVSPRDSVLEAAKRMNDERIGSVVVCDRGQVVGIFTERDILRRVVAECRSPAVTAVGDVMSTPVTCCTPESSIAECQSVMSHNRLRHLPVVEDGRLIGMISSGDVLALEVEHQQRTLEEMHEYLHMGR